MTRYLKEAMSPLVNEYGPHALNMKQALRRAAERCNENSYDSRIVTVRSIGLIATAPPRSIIAVQQEDAIDLQIDGIVFLPKLAQFGVPCADNEEEFFSMQANELVTWLTKDATDDDQAYDMLEPYYKAILNLP